VVAPTPTTMQHQHDWVLQVATCQGWNGGMVEVEEVLLFWEAVVRM